MKNFVKYIFVAAAIAAFTMVATPVAEAAWTQVSGSGARTSVLNNKSGHFEIIDNYIHALGGDGAVYKWSKSITDSSPLSGSWEGPVAGGGGTDVFQRWSDGKFYILGGNGAVYRWDGSWTQITKDGARSTDNFGKSGHFEIATNGFLYALGGNGAVYQWSIGMTTPIDIGNGTWNQATQVGGADVFTRTSDGSYYVLGQNGAVFRWKDTGTWTQITKDGARSSNNSGGKSGHFEIIDNYIYVLGQDGGIYKWSKPITDSPDVNGGSWGSNLVSGGATDVFKKGSDGKFYVMGENGAVYRWDVTADGPFTLTVTKSGTGSGTVTSSPTGINCGSDCSESYAANTSVTLTATPSSGSTFAGWGGDCSSAGTATTCTLTMSASKNVTATFNTTGGGANGTLLGRIYIDTNGNGTWDSGEKFVRDPSGPSGCTNEMTLSGFTVNYSGPSSGSTKADRCNTDPHYLVSVSPGTYTLTLQTPSGYSVTAGNGQVAVTSGQESHVWFGARPTTSTFTITVTKSGTGSGTVTSDPAGINCGTDCSELYTNNSSVTLTATPSSGSTFAGWGGDCASAGTATICTLTMSASKNVIATFNTTGGGIGSFSISLDSSSPAARTITGGSADVLAAVLRFTAVNENINLQQLGLRISDDSNLSAIAKVRIWLVGSTGDLELVGERISPSEKTFIVTLPSGIVIPKDGSKLLQIRVGFNNVGTAQPAQAGDTVSIGYDGSNPSNTRGTGATSGTSISSSTTTNVMGLVITLTGGVNTPPFGFIDIPAGNATVSGTVTVDGWIEDKEDTQIAANQIVFKVDNTISYTPGTAPLGALQRYNRPDVCADITGQSARGITQDQCNTKQPLGVRFTWNTSLLSNGSHAIALAATDSGNLTTSNIGARTVIISGGVTDTTPPGISGVGISNTTSSSATIVWLTNEPSDSQIEYGLATSYGQSTTLDAALVTSHSHTISGLSAGTIYHYRVKSKDAAGNLATSGDYTFSTLSGGADSLYALTVSKSGTGSGTVTSNPAGITCGSDCSESYLSGTSVTLTAISASGSIFAGWSGCDSSSGVSCVMTINVARNVTATFTVTQSQCTDEDIAQITLLLNQAAALLTQCVAGNSAACTAAGEKLSQAAALIAACAAVPPPGGTTGTVEIKRVGADEFVASAPAGTKAWIDNASTQKSENPAFFLSQSTGSHTAYATDVSGYTETAGTCTFPVGGSECQVSDFSIQPSCDGTGCSAPVSVVSNQVSKIVFKYVSGGSVVNGVCGNSPNTCTAGTFQDVADSNTYYLWNCLGSGGGSTASCNMPKTGGVIDTTPPSTPTNLTATAVSANRIDLGWGQSSDYVGVTGYVVYRNGNQIAIASTNTYYDNGLTSLTNYTYTVAARDLAGNTSAQSAPANATTLGLCHGISCPHITTTNLPTATPCAQASNPSSCVPYSAQLTAIGGNTPYTYTQGFCGTSSELQTPFDSSGLRISSSGAISGTVAWGTSSGGVFLCAQVTDSQKKYTTSGLTIPVMSPSDPRTDADHPIIVGGNFPVGTAGVQYSYTLSAIGGVPPYQWTVSTTLPPGLSRATSGSNSEFLTVSGIPSQNGTWPFSASIVDSANQSYFMPTVIITINSSLASLPSCTISGPSSVPINTPFTVSWSNSAGLSSLVSSGWSGPITPLPGAGGLPACPPESSSACQWGGLKFINVGFASVSIIATNSAGSAQCSYGVSGSSTTQNDAFQQGLANIAAGVQDVTNKVSKLLESLSR